jgi:hypothetical protein
VGTGAATGDADEDKGTTGEVMRGVRGRPGATLPAGATVHHVTLNGSAAHYTIRDTNAGREVLVSTPCQGQTWRVHVVAG